MALYYSVLQARNQDFRAPDFFVVLGADPARERKSWVVWEEDGRTPDVVIELLSDSTEREDRGRKRQVYEGLRVGQYYLFDPISCDLSGFTLEERTLVPLRAGDDGGLDCPRLGLRLLVREGTFQGRTTRWLRWVTPDGRVLPTGEERAREHAARAEQEAARAEQEAARAEQEAARAEQEAARANAAEAKAAALAARLRALGIEP
jgi:hypothetical protein